MAVPAHTWSEYIISHKTKGNNQNQADKSSSGKGRRFLKIFNIVSYFDFIHDMKYFHKYVFFLNFIDKDT